MKPSSRFPPVVDDLIARFQAVPSGVPEWAWPFQPPVPLVGAKYRPGRGLLIYASAENLSWMATKPVPSRFKTEDAWNRYRVRYEETGRDSSDFFPDVGIQPVTDGGLFCAGLFLTQRLGLPTRSSPRDFLETIAIMNWCKFSIRSCKNRDYVTDLEKLTRSRPYVVAELTCLHPAVVVLPKQVWRHRQLAAAMEASSPQSRFLPVPQFNATVVNCNLGQYEDRARRLQQRMTGTDLGEWMTQVRSMSRDNAWRYIAMLDEAVADVPGPR